jgi:hypothetical protein
MLLVPAGFIGLMESFWIWSDKASIERKKKYLKKNNNKKNNNNNFNHELFHLLENCLSN